MESQSSVGRSGPSKKDKQPRRSWSSEEELVLLHAFKYLVLKGYKCDNGFKVGLTTLFQRSMDEAFPGANIQAKPHISSKITVWKKNYGSISTMMSRSGFGFIDETNNIYVRDDDIWNDLRETDNNARTMRYKSWPYFKD
ncbi:hypothetical protein PHJA_001896500 [Phtheirospermum japonicum]|uniref:Myb/SANT-like domain-containing protein n=1 Tax=Phtheirospermum japonicum TaxID=374723 RepID=A0A830CMR3_9LAMI|nr:hypothetical protein PHJA_001896500 [Phtheirospermum japonicum]